MNETSGLTAAPRHGWMTVRWTSVATALALILLLPCLVMWFLEPWYFARQMSRDNPHLAVTPRPVRDVSRSPLAPPRLRCFEFSFQTPWEQVDTRRDAKTVAILRFKGGPGVLTFDPAMTSSLSTGLRSNAQRLKSAFGPRALSSGYDWMATELSATPEDIHWWNRTGNVRATVLLGLKQIEVLDSTAIYKVGNEELHGFQLGDPAVTPLRVGLELFDVNGRRYELVITSPQEDGRAVSQADINAIVASMQPVPHN